MIGYTLAKGGLVTGIEIFYWDNSIQNVTIKEMKGKESKMRKNKVLLAATLCCAMIFTAGCGKKSATKDYSKYVELGQYKGIEVTVQSTEVTDDEVTKEIDERLNNDSENKEVKDRAIKKDDIANIDYVGKIDGKEFEGGSAEGTDLTIGSGQFIPGFEDQLIGVKKGETVDVKCTFPEDYQNEDVARKDAVFTVTVNSIKEKVVPKLTDAWVKESSSDEYKTVEAYKEGVKAELVKNKENQAEVQKTADVLTAIVKNSKISGYPEDEIDEYIDEMKQYYEQMMSMYGMTFDQYLEQMGQTEEDFREEAKTAAQATIGRQMVCKMIAKAEGMTVTEEEYKKGLEDYAQKYSTTSKTYTAEEFEEAYGKDVVEENILLEKVLTFITDNAVEKK